MPFSFSVLHLLWIHHFSHSPRYASDDFLINLLLIWESKIDAELRVDKSLDTILGNLIESRYVLRGKLDNILVLIDPGRGDGLGQD